MKEEVKKDTCKKNSKKKIAIGTAIAGTAAIVGVASILKKKKANKEKQAK